MATPNNSLFENSFQRDCNPFGDDGHQRPAIAMRQSRNSSIIQPEHLIRTGQKIHIERAFAQRQSRSLDRLAKQPVLDRTGCDEPMSPHGSPLHPQLEPRGRNLIRNTLGCKPNCISLHGSQRSPLDRMTHPIGTALHSHPTACTFGHPTSRRHGSHTCLCRITVQRRLIQNSDAIGLQTAQSIPFVIGDAGRNETHFPFGCQLQPHERGQIGRIILCVGEVEHLPLQLLQIGRIPPIE